MHVTLSRYLFCNTTELQDNDPVSPGMTVSTGGMFPTPSLCGCTHCSYQTHNRLKPWVEKGTTGQVQPTKLWRPGPRPRLLQVWMLVVASMLQPPISPSCATWRPQILGSKPRLVAPFYEVLRTVVILHSKYLFTCRGVCKQKIPSRFFLSKRWSLVSHPAVIPCPDTSQLFRPHAFCCSH